MMTFSRIDFIKFVPDSPLIRGVLTIPRNHSTRYALMKRIEDRISDVITACLGNVLRAEPLVRPEGKQHTILFEAEAGEIRALMSVLDRFDVPALLLFRDTTIRLETDSLTQRFQTKAWTQESATASAHAALEDWANSPLLKRLPSILDHNWFQRKLLLFRTRRWLNNLGFEVRNLTTGFIGRLRPWG